MTPKPELEQRRCGVAEYETRGRFFCTRTPGHSGPCAAVPHPLAVAKSRYRYVRVVITIAALDGPVEVIAGVEADERPSGEQYASVRTWLAAALEADYATCRDDAELAAIAERIILARWPDRSYFVEVCRKSSEWIQIFAP